MSKPKYVFGSIVFMAAVFVVFSFAFLFAGNANAASTIGTNMLTTGTLEVQNTASAAYLLSGNTLQVGGHASVAYSRFGTSATGHANYVSGANDVLVVGDLEVKATVSFGGVASISGVLHLANGQIRSGYGANSATAFRFQSAAGTSVLTIDTTNLWVGVGATPQTTFEVQGTASASYFLTGNTIQVGGYASVAYNRFGTVATTEAHYISTINDVLIVGDLEVDGSASFAGPASLSNALYISTQGKTGNVGVGTTSPITKFEVLGTSSSTIDFVSQSFVVGRKTASSSTAYIAEFHSTATPSVFFGSAGAKGSCLQLTNTLGKPVFARVVGTTWTVDAVSCR